MWNLNGSSGVCRSGTGSIKSRAPVCSALCSPTWQMENYTASGSTGRERMCMCSEELLKQLHLLSDLHSVEESLRVEDGCTGTPVEVLRSEAGVELDVLLSLRDEGAVDQDNKKYTLSYDTEFNSMRSLTLGKVTGNDALDEEVAQAGSRGFVGCFSSVQYNHIAPLKAALLNRGSSLVSIRGHLLESNCGALADLSTSRSRLDHGDEAGKDKGHREDDTQRDSAVIGGVVTAVVFITLCVVAVMAHFLYQHRQVRRTASIQEKEHRHSLEAAYRAELHLNNSMRDNMKEYYI
ncbi:hypothetical protein NFI96_008365 [Prochilodus magdalenae]|nr:hypothetical protein NFI96_008365 [Prochilodus magdalenae]